jgi:sugar lactone lactonase YvrE
MTFRRYRRIVPGASRVRVVLAAACAAATAVVAPAGSSGRGTVTVVARNLNNPRQVSISGSGAIYVAEAGAGGTACVRRNECLGPTGSITRIDRGRASRVFTGLTSIGPKDGWYATGADGVSVAPDGSVFVQMTAYPYCKPDGALPKRARFQLGYLLVKSGAGGLRRAADVGALECADNFDHSDRNSDPYAVLALSARHAIVADAGANALYDVNGSTVKLLTVLPRLSTGGQSVPTAIALGPDGAYYVGEFGGESPKGKPKNKSRVFRVDPADGKATVYARGFNAISGVTLDRAGNLYVTESSTNRSNGQQATGDVVRVAAGEGGRTRLGAGKLTFPAGAAIGKDGALYVSNFSVQPHQGQLVRIALS